MAATLWIALGGALGSVARYWCGIMLAGISRTFPWGTVFINIGGSFLIAFFGALTVLGHQGRPPISENIRLFVMVGFCGGFTTFSSFSLQNFDLIRSGEIMRGFANMAFSVIFCLIATTIGAIWAEKIVDSGTHSKMTVEAALKHGKIVRNPQEEEA